MTGFVEWLAARRLRMILLTAALAVMPLLGLLSQAVIVFAVLVHGLAEGIIIAVAASVLMLVPILMAGASPLTVIFVMLLSWLPAIGLAEILRRSRSLSLSVQVATVIMSIVVLLLFALTDPAQSWTNLLAQHGNQLAPQLDQLPAEVRQRASEIMTGLVAGMSLIGVMLAIFAGRWWQSLLQRPGAFAEEFRNLGLGRLIAIVAAVIFMAAGITGLMVLENLVLVLVAAYLLHGLAVIHAVAAVSSKGSFWLVGTYVVLIVAAPFAPLTVAAIGFVDSWFNLRARLNAQA